MTTTLVMGLGYLLAFHINCTASYSGENQTMCVRVGVGGVHVWRGYTNGTASYPCVVCGGGEGNFVEDTQIVL